MDQSSFGRLARAVAAAGTRRSLLRNMSVGVAALAGLGTRSAAAQESASLTIRNASCPRNPGGGSFVSVCQQFGFGPVEFDVSGVPVVTNTKGRATASVGSGSVSISQDSYFVGRSKRIFVSCVGRRPRRAPRRLHHANANDGTITISPRKNERVTCDWYNVWVNGVRPPIDRTDPTCLDTVKNNDETDVDCGGPLCPKCANGSTCQGDADCVSDVCDPSTDTCVECVDSDDCPEGRKFCESYVCRECGTEPGGCTDPAKPYCVNFACVECTDNGAQAECDAGETCTDFTCTTGTGTTGSETADLWASIGEPAIVAAWAPVTDFMPVEGHTFSIHPGDREGNTLSWTGRVLKVTPLKQIIIEITAPEFDRPFRLALALTREDGEIRLDVFNPDGDRAVCSQGRKLLGGNWRDRLIHEPIREFRDSGPR